jgi:hypothetical protein
MRCESSPRVLPGSVSGVGYPTGPGYPSGCPGLWAGCPDGLQVRGCVVSRSMIATVIVVVVIIVLAIVLLQFLR